MMCVRPILEGKNQHFQCDMCGLCCQNIGLSDTYRNLDRGDGVCKYYEFATHKCSIYHERPLLCNVDAYYDKYMANKMSRQEFHELNYETCRKLREDNV